MTHLIRTAASAALCAALALPAWAADDTMSSASADAAAAAGDQHAGAVERERRIGRGPDRHHETSCAGWRSYASGSNLASRRSIAGVDHGQLKLLMPLAST